MIADKDIEVIYRLYIRDLYNYALYLGTGKDLAMDLIHDVFCKLCTEPKTIFRVENVEPYLFRALKNSLLNIQKSKSSSSLVLDELADNSILAEGVEDLYISKEDELEIKTKINEMMASLTKRQQEIIYLKYALEYDYEQIAQIMAITPASCRKLVHKAMTELRQKFPYQFLLIFLYSQIAG